jgi:hypothetical protein
VRIEEQYAEIRSRARVMTLRDLLAQANRSMTHRSGVRALTQPGVKRRRALERAANRMHIDDLDAAWRAALRGEHDVAVALVAESVSVERPDTHKGTPWRKSGWLNR